MVSKQRTKLTLAGLLIILFIGLAFFVNKSLPSPSKITPEATESAQPSPPSATTKVPTSTVTPSKTSSVKIKILKDVGEAYMDNFGLTESDFQLFKNARVNIIEGNFDICATDSDVNYFLNQSLKYGIRVIMPAGSGEAEWGYACNGEPFPADQMPVWNKTKVVAWVNKWKNNPAIYAWDTSNEAGSVLPDPSPEKMLTLDQLTQAYKDVKSIDSTHPIMIRQNGWFFYDNDNTFFRDGNPFGKNVADIVMVNAYSNVEDYFPDFVLTVMNRSINALKSLDSHIQVIASLGVWEEKPLWTKPTVEHLNHDIDQLKNQVGVIGVAYFKYGAKGSEWYLPDSKNGAPELFSVVSKSNFD